MTFRLDDQEAATTIIAAAIDTICNVHAAMADRCATTERERDALAQRAATAEQERDAALAQNAQSAEDIARYNALVDRLIELAHKAQAVTQG